MTPPPTNSSSSSLSAQDALGLRTALAAARKSYAEGGVPIGASLVLPHSPGEPDGAPVVLGQGHNARVQLDSPILHGETAALLDAGRLKAEVYRQATMVRLRSHMSATSSFISFTGSLGPMLNNSIRYYSIRRYRLVQCAPARSCCTRSLDS